MSWIALTEAHVLSKIDNTRVSTFRAAALKGGQSDPLTESISEVMNLVRGYVPSARGASGTIPEETIPIACDLVIVSFLNRVNAPVSESQSKAQSTAMSILRDMQRGDFRIALPTTLASETTVKPVPCIVEPKDTLNFVTQFGTKFDLSSQDGI